MSKHNFLQSIQSIVYCAGSDTIRIAPNNYVLMTHRGGSWEVWADAAAPLVSVVAAAAATLVHDLRWGSGYNMAEHLNSVMPLYHEHNMMVAIEAVGAYSQGCVATLYNPALAAKD